MKYTLAFASALAALAVVPAWALGCSGDDPAAGEDTFVPGPSADDAGAPLPPNDVGEDDGGADGGPDTAPDAGPGQPSCKKHITVIFTVGVPGTSKMKSNGCWTPVIADGAATKAFRKCSTSNFQVSNGTAPNWAYDDTSPAHSLSQEKAYLANCSNGATGDGYEYMAYRGGWRLLGATHLRAYFAELYGGSNDRDIDSLWYVNGAYRNNTRLAGHHVYPMINFGPPKAAHLEAKVGLETARTCATVADRGYFGAYNWSWREGMTATDPRLVALEKALDKCTGK